MFPTLFGEGAWALPSYFAMLMLGFFVGTVLLRHEAIRIGWDPVKIVDLSLAILIASIVGARLAHVLFDGMLMDYVHLCTDPSLMAEKLPTGLECASDAQCLSAQNSGYDIGALCQNGLCVPERDCFRSLMFWSGGLTYYGGFILAVLTAIVLTRRWKWNFLAFADLAAPSAAIGLALGRVGCHLAGCCFGVQSKVSWAIRFPAGSDAWRKHRIEDYPALVEQHAELGEWLSLPVHPTQLYEVFGALAIFAYLWFYVRKRSTYHGQSLAILLMAYAVLRFVIEIFRDDVRGGYILSTSQWISIPLFIAGAVLMFWGSKHLPKDQKSKAND